MATAASTEAGQTGGTEFFVNTDLHNIKTPVDPNCLEHVLEGYEQSEKEFQVSGFKRGFTLGFQHTVTAPRYAENLKSTTSQGRTLWEKIMNEVKLGRYAGPFEKPPFDNLWQSPLGLVEKKNRPGVRMIFHLSFPKDGLSINSGTPKNLTSVKYPEFDQTVHMCVNKGKGCFLSKIDLKSAFRQVPLKPAEFHLTGAKAVHPDTGQEFWFVDKCLPFGAAISCSHFQRLSNALKYATECQMLEELLNYLDDFLFCDTEQGDCDWQLDTFIDTCTEIGLPVAEDKTERALQQVVFLGLLLDTVNQIIGIPLEKIERALERIELFLKAKTVTVQQLQSIAGVFEFFCRAVPAGRAFNRRLYDAIPSGKKGSFHINVNKCIKEDLKVWKSFLTTAPTYRSFMDVDMTTAEELSFFTDASGNAMLGFGCYFHPNWMYGVWPRNLLGPEATNPPSIAWLELYALVVAATLWGSRLKNKCVIVRCDNKAVVGMVNMNTSKSEDCMTLVRLLVKASLRFNFRLYARYIAMGDNVAADSLSRLQFDKFFQVAAPGVSASPTSLPVSLWPVSKLRLSGSKPKP